VPIDVGVALLQSPQNPELEVVRRKQLFDDAVRSEQERAEEQKRAEVAAEKARKEHLARRPERWAALPREVRALYVAAAEITETNPRTPSPLANRSPAAAFVALAKLLSGPNYRLDQVPRTFEPELAS